MKEFVLVRPLLVNGGFGPAFIVEASTIPEAAKNLGLVEVKEAPDALTDYVVPFDHDGLQGAPVHLSSWKEPEEVHNWSQLRSALVEDYERTTLFPSENIILCDLPPNSVVPKP